MILNYPCHRNSPSGKQSHIIIHNQILMPKLSLWKMRNEIGYNDSTNPILAFRRHSMLGTDIRGILAEEEEVQRRQQALKSLLSMRAKQLRESLEERIKRARSSGDWTLLSREECASLHKQEKAYLRSQFQQLQHEQDRTRGKLTALKRAKARAQRMRAAEAASGRKRR
jgi:hypothetical protein